MIPYLEVTMRTRGVRAVGGINDVPILYSDALGQPKQSRMPLNWWLMPGPNLLTVRVEPLDGAQGAPMLDAGIAFPKDENPPLCRVGWGMPLGVPFAPYTIAMPFHPPKPARSRVWQDAVVVEELSDHDRQGAQALAARVHHAFAARDVDVIMKLLGYRLEEMCLAFEMDLARHRAAVREEMTDLVDGKGYALTPVEQDAIQVNPCCGGRIFQLARPDGGQLIYTLPTEIARPTTMQVFASLIGGEWRVVR